MRLLDYVLSEQNIYLAIYAVKSYVFDYQLLSHEDKKLLNNLSDPFNVDDIKRVIRLVHQKLNLILNTNELFGVQAYFKPKDYNEANDKVEFRPIHTAQLIDLIAMVAMLHVLIYELPTENDYKLNMSNFSRLIPNNFYGNRVSKAPEELFRGWSQAYKEYTQKANDYFHAFNLSGEYRYELKLDLVQFFPSVNPLHLYYNIIEKTPVSMNAEDSRTLKTIVYKLLICKVTNINSKYERQEYYKGVDNPFEITTYTMGIAQGLPQSYFFGNISMIEISNLFKERFKGKAVYYVDDSYIYTNEVDVESFPKVIRELNERIEKITKTSLKKGKLSDLCSLSDYKIFYNTVSSDRFIKIHQSEKSFIFDIRNAREGEKYLHNLSREASCLGAEVNNAFSENEDDTMLNKAVALVEAIDREIERVREQNCDGNEKDENSYLEKLQRYRKYFLYRQIKLELRSSFDAKKSILKTMLGYELNNNNTSAESVFQRYLKQLDCKRIVNMYKDDVLQVAIDMAIINGILKEYQIKKYIEHIIFSVYRDKMENCSYIGRYYEDFLHNKTEITQCNVYETLEKTAHSKLHRYSIMHGVVLVEHFKGTIFKGIEDCILGSYHILSPWFINTVRIVDSNSDRLKRMFINTVYSVLFKVTASDQFTISCYNKKGITYGALRLLINIRNSKCKILDFLNWDINLKSFDNLQKIDFDLLEVLETYKKYVKEPERIDKLICIHKYTCDIWKNGAKHLYFYTLHNQEHAIDLIKNIVKLVKTFSYIKITAYDYYLLFAACYLHDISMVKTASRNDFLLDPASDEITYTLSEKWNMSDSFAEKKQRVVETYHDVDAFYEKKIRSNHGRDSADEIRSRTDLSFLVESEREIIADIAESHMMDTRDVYYAKGDAKSKLISNKFNRILLRIADLLDMSEHRVSRAVLNHNFDNMSELSAFHWVSHLLTSGYSLVTQYSLTPHEGNVISDLEGDIVNASESGLSDEQFSLSTTVDSTRQEYLVPGAINEEVTLEIYVKLSQMTAEKCQHCKYMHLDDDSVDSTGLTLICPEKRETCNSNHCNFLCRWFNKKNAYMVQEIFALNEYFNRVPVEERFYNTSVKIKVVIKDSTKIPDEHFEILKGELDKQ